MYVVGEYKPMDPTDFLDRTGSGKFATMCRTRSLDPSPYWSLKLCFTLKRKACVSPSALHFSQFAQLRQTSHLHSKQDCTGFHPWNALLPWYCTTQPCWKRRNLLTVLNNGSSDICYDRPFGRSGTPARSPLGTLFRSTNTSYLLPSESFTYLTMERTLEVSVLL